VRKVAELWLAKVAGGSKPEIRGRSLQVASAAMSAASENKAESHSGVAVVRNLKVKNGTDYQVVPGGFSLGAQSYVDRSYRLSHVPTELEGADLVQTANNDDNSRGKQWLSADALVPVRVWVGIDVRQKTPPSWVLKDFRKVPLTAAIDEGSEFNFYERTCDAGTIELGGNTDDGHSGGKGNYIVAIAPLPLGKQPTKATLDASFALLERGDRDRGELLYRHATGAGCGKCHSLDQAKNGFGPNLSSIGLRANARHIVQSIVNPSAVITEGFNQLTVVTDEGKIFSGVLLEESGLTLSLGQSNGQRVDIPKASIEDRKTNRVSAMPEMAENLTPQQVADLTTFLLSLRSPPTTSEVKSGTGILPVKSTVPNGLQAAGSKSERMKTDRLEAYPTNFSFVEQKDRLRISLGGQPIVDFVFRDEEIQRPYFANARLTNGVQVTRNHPPIKDVDAVDHDTMHPGIWLGFGDLSGQDFWRNKATMEHLRFVMAPTTSDGRLRFVTECRLKTNSGEPLCLLTNDFTLTARPNGWLLVWNAEFRADQREIVFGDQEEMGFGARVATSFTEKNGGMIRSSTDRKSAKETWGQAAQWCDYSGTGPQSGGILLMASDKNFRNSWWHNRDYGVFVANPFGREAMKQGARSAVTVTKGETLRLTYGALIHDQRELDPQFEFDAFEQISSTKSNLSGTE
jgi:putative heme-binding domain-containing protein